MKTLTKSILEYAEAQPAGTVLSAERLLHLGSRAAVNQALPRLIVTGGLLRVCRGSYVSPVSSRFGRHPPRAALVAASIVANQGGEMASHGATAANTLGLTTQVPTSAVYATTGPSRTLRLGRQIVELRHAPSWQFAVGGLAGEAVRALAWLGEKRGHGAIGMLRSRLSAQERQALLQARPRLPSWMAQQVGGLA